MGEVNTTQSPGVGWKKSKSLSFTGKERFLKSVNVKSNHENMKSNDGIFFHHVSENEGTRFFGWFFK